MKQQWDVEELIEQFTLLPPEVEWLGENEEHNHLGKAILLKFFQVEGRFPENGDHLKVGAKLYWNSTFTIS